MSSGGSPSALGKMQCSITARPASRFTCRGMAHWQKTCRGQAFPGYQEKHTTNSWPSCLTQKRQVGIVATDPDTESQGWHGMGLHP